MLGKEKTASFFLWKHVVFCCVNEWYLLAAGAVLIVYALSGPLPYKLILPANLSKFHLFKPFFHLCITYIGDVFIILAKGQCIHYPAVLQINNFIGMYGYICVMCDQ